MLDRSWIEDDSVTGDATCTWGVAFRGFQPRDSVAGAGPGYDDHDYGPGAPDRLDDHYRPVELAAIGDTGIWRTAEITLRDVRFANGQNAGADFRVRAGEGRDLVVRAARVTKSS